MQLDTDTKSPTKELQALITDKWLKQAKREILALEHPDPCEWQQIVKHVQGCYAGDVQDCRVYAVNANQVMRHYAMDWTTGGHHFRWKFIPKHQLWLSHDLFFHGDGECEFTHDGLHEATEEIGMRELHIPYEEMHAHSNWYEKQWMEELGLGEPIDKAAKKHANNPGKIRLPWDAKKH